ncbi:hypothetical protein [Staphylococcus felis]|uniref:hypothetical protein n=1 Tax=Staphylococcus felis TaxID=46127 RepID=UPI0024800FE6|nr:hypothetical protein [Staphylococcus felis]
MIRHVFLNKYIQKKISREVSNKYKDAKNAIYENDLERFISYFFWLKKGTKILLLDKDLKQISDDGNNFELTAPYSSLINLQIDKQNIILQAQVYNLNEKQINNVVIQSRNDYKKSIKINDVSKSNGIITFKLRNAEIRSLEKGIYNVLICYDDYKLINIKYGFNKEIFGITLYPTVNGNLSIKK